MTASGTEIQVDLGQDYAEIREQVAKLCEVSGALRMGYTHYPAQ